MKSPNLSIAIAPLSTPSSLPRNSLLAVASAVVATIVGCSAAPVNTPVNAPSPHSEIAAAPAQAAAQQGPWNPAQIERGAEIYGRYCGGCHGARAEGTPIGPSLNGTGHTWHHPLHVLRDKTENGFRNMPAYKNKLSDQEIDDVIAWFQSLWPEQVYQNWKRRWYTDDPSFRTSGAQRETLAAEEEAQ